MGGFGSFRLGDWRVEPAANLLTRGDEAVRLELKPMEVLTCLTDHAGEVVSKRDLIDEVWHTEFIAENTLTHAIAELRRALGDDARHPIYIETIPKRGYRLLAEVVPAEIPPAGAPPEIDEPERPVFVARDAELDRLDALLERALQGHGTVAFITGEAGTGKTALAFEFARRAQARHADLVVAAGACSAATGAGDPYGPWRQMLAQLTGDAEAAAGGGMFGPKQAARLWSVAPAAGRAVAEVGLDLVETLIPGRALVQRMAGFAPANESWLAALSGQAELRSAIPAVADIRQSALFEQAARVVRRVTESCPLLLILEDLHWIDAGSANLLFHLGRRLAGSRVLVVGTFRPSEISLGRDGGRHPAEQVLHELKREHGDTDVELFQVGERAFVDAIVDAEPNDLEESFRAMLYDRTRGHALFTVELLRTMQERGVLERDDDGRWIAAVGLDWGALPARVEGVLEERIGRLPDDLRELMTVASVEGEDFTAEVVARVRRIPDGEVVKRLAQDLERRHRLVTGRGVRLLATSRVSRFSFGHALFADHFYRGLDDAERAYLHDDVGTVLEGLYSEQLDQVAAELAHHFERAGRIDKAVSYLGMAAARASSISAFAEAENLNRRAIELLSASPRSAERDVAAIEHLRMMVTATAGRCGWAHPEVRRLAEELERRCDRAGDTAGLSWALFQLISHHGNRGEIYSLEPLLATNLELAEASGDRLLVMTAHWCHLYIIWAGRPASALEHLEITRSLLDEQTSERFFRLNGIDPRAVVPMWIGLAQLFLGYGDHAVANLFAAVSSADTGGNPFSRAFVRGIVGPALVYAGIEAGVALSEECIAIASERGFEEIKLYGMLGRVYDAASRGDAAPNEKYIAMLEASGYLQPLPWCLRLRCELLLAAGRAADALPEITRAQSFTEESGQRFNESDLDRIAGDAALQLGDPAGAEQAYRRAIEVARRQRMKPFELAATVALARLWQAQGKVAEALGLLQPVYDWFTGGFDAQPLLEARALLDELTG